MDKTITVKVKTFNSQGPDFVEYEFPELKKYLAEGYNITNVITDAVTAGNAGYYYITFHLRKM